MPEDKATIEVTRDEAVLIVSWYSHARMHSAVDEEDAVLRERLLAWITGGAR